ncbi:RAD55 family ATPase [Candidatus Altiarchaeota archaeon]
MLVSTGLSELDKKIGGGIPSGLTVLLEGEPGTGKTTISRQFIYEGLQKGWKNVFLVTVEPIRKIIEEMKAIGLDPTPNKEDIVFVDVYGWRYRSKKEEEVDGIHILTTSGPLSDISVVLRNCFIEMGIESGGLLVFDSLSDLFIHEEQVMVLRFLETLVARLHERNITSYFTVESGMHDHRVLASLSYILNGTIKLKIEEEKRSLQIARMEGVPHNLGWLSFQINEGIASLVT